MVVYANTVTYMYMYIVTCLVHTYVHNRTVRRVGKEGGKGREWKGGKREREREGERERHDFTAHVHAHTHTHTHTHTHAHTRTHTHTYTPRVEV